MDNITSQSALRASPAGQEFPRNGARAVPLPEQLVSSTSATFAGAWSVLRTVLRKAQTVILLPTSALAILTPAWLKSWLAERLEALRGMLRAVHDRVIVRFNRKEIDLLTRHFIEEREVTDNIHRRMVALPEAAQREFNRVYCKQSAEQDKAIRTLLDLVNAQAERQHNVRDRMASTMLPPPAVSAQIPAPEPARPRVRAREAAADRENQLQQDIARLTRELAELQAEHTED